eukprot:Plantae.Rhodophyta-Purpureofilum_apyrenoidigerum.ctg27801.p1 GENE.Plantae.Rhodophyta-Purpureofilum_apyrenoidigerum.ctg27801~~Plantae.Rhodophyta-Purpureofilum_apyrenoidigerum.ctg27801.p1  ORF type:complete len:394 (+),score=90.83 Plantae.Rhodophyta-Purpureofilum_apyrenoidigerum.ctg27801:2-1183(+)
MAFVVSGGVAARRQLGGSMFTPPVCKDAQSVRRQARRAVLRMSTDYNELGRKFEKEMADPVEIIDRALTDFGDDAAIAFSGAEDVVLVEYASRTGKSFRVFALDTGRLHPETYRFFDQVEKHYKIRIEYVFPEKQEVEDLVNEKGLFSFYEDGHQECCRVRKVRPLRKKLSSLRAWITGQRKDQSPGTRADVPVVQVDPAFKGVGDSQLVKFNPLSDVTSAEVWALIRMVDVPYNALHEKGFTSIGCEPCTKPVLPNQHEREGRWWWEEATQKECGLHKGNISMDAAKQEEAKNLVSDKISSNPVMVFTKSTCPYCLEVKELFKSLRVKFEDLQVDKLDNAADVMEALKEKTNQTTVPNVFINRKHIGGLAETKALNQQGELTKLLEKAKAVV